MKRIHLFEFEDLAVVPHGVRSSLLKLLNVLHEMLGTADVVSNALEGVREEVKFSHLLDLGSGAGGVMPQVLQRMRKGGAEVELTLTDLYPNPRYIEALRAQYPGQFHYQTSPLSAREAIAGSAREGELTTLLNSFHHLAPDQARELLHQAQLHRKPLFIYELGENKVPLLLWWLLLPVSLFIMLLMVWVMTPRVKGLTLFQVVFTYLIPIIPLLYGWDGQVSSVRMYTRGDIEELIGNWETSDYQWTYAPALKPNGKGLGYTLLGLPKN